ncbi:M23 family metallopeptidase [Lacinutrix mariniflava]|uniref:M23 family metallopeptidase n=1 Tax=Lacinutrix mariniflava TaxID=342955 RepID=UPI0006E40187|nr:M23 family metallopeptidase [Lacinutrix mariniflava]
MAGRNRTLVLEAEVSGRSFSFEDQELALVGDDPEIITAYFAEKKNEYVEKDHEDPFTFKFSDDNNDLTNKDDDLVDDAKRRKLASYIYGKVKADGDKKYTTNTKVYDALTEASYKTDDEITITTYKKEKKEYYSKITTAPMGYQVYLVAETKKLDGKTLKIKILESKSQNQEKTNVFKLVKTETDKLPVLVFAKLEDKTTTTEAGDWIEIDIKKQDQKILGKTEGTEIEVGIKKIQLRPKEDKIASEKEDAIKSFEGWQEALYIREDETVAGKKAVEDAKKDKADRDQEVVKFNFNKGADKKTYPAGKIDAPKTAIIGKAIEYILDIDIKDKDYKYKATATEEDKKNIRWSLYVQGEAKTDKKGTYITAKTKTGVYTYAKTEVVDKKIKLTIVFDKALKGKKVQIEPFRGAPDLTTKPDYVRTTTIKEAATSKITIRDKAHLYLKTQCDSIEEEGETIDNEFLKSTAFKLETPRLLFPFQTIPLNHPDGFKNDNYIKYDYTLHEKKAPTFGVLRSSTRIHAARDLYYELNEPIYAIANGVVTDVHSFYRDTWRIEIEHEYQKIKGFDLVVRYGEVNKNNILVKKGDYVKRGQKIAEIGLLVPHVHQPSGEKRGMLHIEFYTGEGSGNLSDTGIKYNEMLYAKSGKHISGSSFQRRKDLFDPLPLLKKMYINSKKEGSIK